MNEMNGTIETNEMNETFGHLLKQSFLKKGLKQKNQIHENKLESST